MTILLRDWASWELPLDKSCSSPTGQQVHSSEPWWQAPPDVVSSAVVMFDFRRIDRTSDIRSILKRRWSRLVYQLSETDGEDSTRQTSDIDENCTTFFSCRLYLR